MDVYKNEDLKMDYLRPKHVVIDKKSNTVTNVTFH
jgi:hypothetical protein